MSDTPRTDAAWKHGDRYDWNHEVVLANFARQLERELAEAKDKAHQLTSAYVELWERSQRMKSELAGLRAQREKLQSALDNASLIYDAAKDQRDRLAVALKDCVDVMERELAGLRVIQPELRQANEALESLK